MAVTKSVEFVDVVSSETKVAKIRYDEASQELQVSIEQGAFSTIVLGATDPTFATKVIFASGASLNFLATAITENVTTTSLPAGSIAFTTHAIGRGKIFYSDGSKWQLVTAVAA